MRLTIGTAAGDAWVDLDRPPKARALLVLTHGAGGGVESRELLAIRSLAMARGIALGMVTQPYRVAGRRSPPGPQRQDDAWLTIMAALRRRRAIRELLLVVGGRSNGARVACRTAAASGAGAVVALAYPLHPPGRPEASRLGELNLPSVPVLVVQGDRDPFGMPPQGPGRHIVVVAGADHSLKQDLAAVADAVVEFVLSASADAAPR